MVSYDLWMHWAGVFGLRDWKRRNDGFQRHPALWAVARPLLAYLGIHRACVFVRDGFARGARHQRNLHILLRNSLGRCRSDLRRMRRDRSNSYKCPWHKVFSRVSAEFRFAPRAAEVVRLSSMLEHGFRSRGVHRHSANGVLFQSVSRFVFGVHGFPIQPISNRQSYSIGDE